MTGGTLQNNETLVGGNLSGGTLLTSVTSQQLTANIWTPLTATYTSGSSVIAGQNLAIVITMNSHPSITQLAFDDVTLTAANAGPGPANAYKITANTTTPAAGTSDTITITQVDASGNTETGYNGTTNLTFSGLSAGPDSSAATVNGTSLGTATSITFSGGVATATLVAHKAETATLNATDGTSSTSSTGGAGISLTVSDGTAAKLAYTSAPSTGTAGTVFSMTVQSQDTYGNPANLASATTITLSKATGGGTLSGTLTGSIGSGANSVTISTPLYSKSDTMTLTATASGGVTLTAVTSGNIVFSPGTATKLAYTMVPSTGTAGTAFSVTVQSQDANGNASSPTSNTTISLSKATGAGTLSGTLTGTITTSGNSVSIATAVYSKSDTMTLTATATAGETSLTAVTSGNIVFSAGAVTAAQSAVSASPTSVTADGATTSTVTVTLKDVNSNPVSGKTVTLAKTSGSGTPTISAASGASDAAGVVTFTVKSTTAAADVFTATDTTDSVTVTQTATVTFTAATTSTLTASPNPSLPGTNVTFTATLSAVPSGSGTPTGTVLFKTNGVPLGAPVTLDGSGVAAFITNSLPHGSNTVTAEYAGDGCFLGSTNSVVQVVNTPPVASLATYTRNSGFSYKILISGLLANSTSDADSDARTLASVGSSTNGATITTNGTWIFYVPPPASNINSNATDYFSYTISDGFAGGTTNGLIRIAVTDSNVGPPSSNLIVATVVSNGMLITFVGIPNYAYRVQRTTTLAGESTGWTDLGTSTVNAGGNGAFTDTSPPSGQAYYRTTWP